MSSAHESGDAPVKHASPEADFQAWQKRRFDDLSASDSWLGVVGLSWLDPGRNAVGGAGCQVAVPSESTHLGDLLVDDGVVVWIPVAAKRVTVDNPAAGESDSGSVRLRTDADGDPSRLRCGDLELFVIERDGRLAVRVRDLAWQRKRAFAGIEYYAFHAAWRLEADWVELAQPVVLEVPTVTGELKSVTVSRQAVFSVGEGSYALLPLEVGEDGIFFVFRDSTSGRETYGGGRFLRAEVPSGGRLVLDFNRAFNPPCAFTPFAACPLPPPENWLPIPIRAGEKKYAAANPSTRP